MSIPSPYQKFNLVKNCNKKIKRPRVEREGEIMFYNGNNNDYYQSNRPYLCVKNRNKYIWKEISNISGAKFNSNKEEIADSLEEMYMKFRMMENSHNVTKRKLKSKNKECDAILIYMFNKMDVGQRIAFYMEYPEIQQQFKKYSCNTCSNLSNKTFKKCRHDDCIGMCENCYNSWNNGSSININSIFEFGHISTCKTQCPACKKNQNYECPICYDEKPEKDMMFSDNCDHFICKNCFCNSFDSNPIVDCPMCRTHFRNTLTKTNYNDGAPEDAILV